MTPPCRYEHKKQFRTRQDARVGAENIKVRVEYHGNVYSQLYPYKCPDADHWHLSHYPQGFRTCMRCLQRVASWHYTPGRYWVIGPHVYKNHPCQGEGDHQCASSLAPSVIRSLDDAGVDICLE